MGFTLPSDITKPPEVSALGAATLKHPEATQINKSGVRALGATAIYLAREQEKTNKEATKLAVQDRLNQYNRELNKASNSIFSAKGKDASERLKDGLESTQQFKEALISEGLDDRTSAFVNGTMLNGLNGTHMYAGKWVVWRGWWKKSLLNTTSTMSWVIARMINLFKRRLKY